MQAKKLILIFALALLLTSTVSLVLSFIDIDIRENTKSNSAVLAQTADTLKFEISDSAQIAASGVQSSRPSLTRTNDPYLDRQWSLSKIPSLPAGGSQKSTEIVVAVLDTGIDGQHEDLLGKVIASEYFSDGGSAYDVNGHGTHVAGIIAASANNGIGISGIAPNVHLLNVKVAEDNGMVWASNVAQGIRWAVDHGARVINMSLAVPSRSVALEEAIKYAWSKDVVLVAAVGNYVRGTTYPAAIPEVIAVAALNPEGAVWSESNDGDFVDVYAPGVEIYSTLPGNQYGYYDGSSMAAAHVSALAARAFELVVDQDGDGLLNSEVVELITSLFARP